MSFLYNLSHAICYSRFCVFELSLGSSGATYVDHLRFIGKGVVDFVIVLIKLYSLGITAEALQENIG